MPLEVVNPVKVADYVYIDDEDIDKMVGVKNDISLMSQWYHS